MAQRHTSFLLRCWDLGNDSERIEIEHIQSGTKVLARSVGVAIEWICAHGAAIDSPEPVAQQVKPIPRPAAPEKGGANEQRDPTDADTNRSE